MARDLFRGLRPIWASGAILAGAILWAIELPFFICHPDWQLLLRELAFALLIACVFGLTIEQIQRSEFIRLVTEEREVLKQDVFLYAYGSYLPDQIRQEIRQSILSNAFYRDGIVIDWEFSTVEGQPDYLSLKKSYMYNVINSSDVAREWCFTFMTGGADDLSATTSRFGCLRIKRNSDAQPEQFNEKDLVGETFAGQPHTRQLLSKPLKFSAKESVGIYVETTTTRRIWGEDRYTSKDPIVGQTRVKLRFPPDFDVQVSCRARPLDPATDHDPPKRYSLQWNEGILPHQGITISWSRREGVRPGEQAAPLPGKY